MLTGYQQRPHIDIINQYIHAEGTAQSLGCVLSLEQNGFELKDAEKGRSLLKTQSIDDVVLFLKGVRRGSDMIKHRYINRGNVEVANG